MVNSAAILNEIIGLVRLKFQFYEVIQWDAY
jgi:hypothetical protein